MTGCAAGSGARAALSMSVHGYEVNRARRTVQAHPFEEMTPSHDRGSAMSCAGNAEACEGASKSDVRVYMNNSPSAVALKKGRVGC